MGPPEIKRGTPSWVVLNKKGREGEVIIQDFTKVKLLLRSCELFLFDSYIYSNYFIYPIYEFKRFYSKTSKEVKKSMS